MCLKTYRIVAVWKRAPKGSCSWTYSPKDPAQREQIAPRLEVKEANLLILKFQLQGQASNLTHTSKSLTQHTPGMKTATVHLGTLPLFCSSSPVSPKNESIYLFGALVFATAAQRTLPDHLTNGLMLVVLQECLCLHTFKSCCLRVWLPNSLNLGTKILP